MISDAGVDTYTLYRDLVAFFGQYGFWTSSTHGDFVEAVILPHGCPHPHPVAGSSDDDGDE